MDKGLRKKIIHRIGHLEDSHCESCTKIRKDHRGNSTVYCNTQCEVGKELRSLGDKLASGGEKKPKPTIGEVEKVEKVDSKNLTEELFNDLKAKGKSNKEIADILGKSVAWLYMQKKQWEGSQGMENTKSLSVTEDQFNQMKHDNKALRLEIEKANEIIKDLEAANVSAHEKESGINNSIVEELADTKEKMEKLYKFVGKIVVENNLVDLG